MSPKHLYWFMMMNYTFIAMQCSKNQNSVRNVNTINPCHINILIIVHSRPPLNTNGQYTLTCDRSTCTLQYLHRVFVQCSRYEQQRPGPPVPRGEGGHPAVPEPAPRTAEESSPAAGTRAVNEPSLSFTVPGEGPF